MLADIRQARLAEVEAVRSSRVYLLSGSLLDSDVRLIAEELLADPVAETYHYGPGLTRRHGSGGSRSHTHPAVEIHALPGVMDPVAISALEATRRLLKARGSAGARVSGVRTARRYEIVGLVEPLSDRLKPGSTLDRLAGQVLANSCIETWYVDGAGRCDPIPEVFPTPPVGEFVVRHVPLRGLGDEELTRLSRESHLFLSLAEMQAIRDHFHKRGSDPTDLEIETLAQTWSEHCVHKTLKSEILYRGEDFGRSGRIEAHFENLLKDTIVAATTTLDRKWCLSVFVDNAGVIAFDDEFGIAFKAETHNHPSAIEPYGGAATGIGGCIRDIMGCGLGAKPIASTDVFCLAPPDFDSARLPKDVLHPRRVLKGVVRGVRDYGNRMGIPTVNGAIHFDERYLANPLVFCGCVGLIPRDRIAKDPQAGDRIVVAGGRTGRDGIHGATFSSAELTDTHASEFSHAVQIGNAVTEKKVLDALLIARDHPEGCLYSAVTDCGAGGLSSAVGEMGAELGAVVDLDDVPLKYAGLRYDEIWISEAQERMVFSVPPDRLEALLAVFAGEEVEATVIGTFTDDHVLRVRYQGRVVGELDMEFLHNGLPRSVRTAVWTPRQPEADQQPDTATSDRSLDGNERLLGAVGALNTASKEWVIRQYDHEVQGRSVIKPLAGPGAGPSDAAVLRPLYDSSRGIAIGCGMCPELADVDPYWMAVAAVDEALRNVICVGADPDHTCILDNFCWPKCDTEESLGTLVRACRGAADAAVAFGLPFVSGKDSLNNEFTMSEEEARRVGLPTRIAIPPTLLISALGIVNDVRGCVSMDLKRAGNRLVLASAPMTASMTDVADPNRDPKGEDSVARLKTAHALHRGVAGLIRAGKVRAAHDVSDGGLAVAVAEMCIASGFGAAVNVGAEVYRDSIFAPVTTSYVLEMSEVDAVDAGLPVIGRVEAEPRMRLRCEQFEPIDLSVTELADAWRAPLGSGGL